MIEKILDCPEENVDRNMDIKGHFGEDSDRNNEHVIEHWRGDDLCYRVQV